METPISYATIQQWYDDYFHSYLSRPSLNDDDIDAITLKHLHSYRVMDLMISIATGIGLSPEDLELAKIIGILHDVARFSQYTQYHTMHDSQSIDHGELGAKIIRDESPLSQGFPSILNLVCLAVLHHNKLEIPNDLTPRERLFCQMIRDADKLDVFALACPIYQKFPDQLGEKLKMHLPSHGDPTPEVIAAVLRKTSIDVSILQNMTDFKLFQLAWVFDFNFSVSIDILQTHGYLQILFDSLHPFPEKAKIISIITAYISQFLDHA
ncbi:MAG: HD domain-containing protein [Promethearchaeota archaeon]